MTFASVHASNETTTGPKIGKVTIFHCHPSTVGARLISRGYKVAMEHWGLSCVTSRSRLACKGGITAKSVQDRPNRELRSADSASLGWNQGLAL